MNTPFIDFKIVDIPELTQWPERRKGENARRVLIIHSAGAEDADTLQGFLARIVGAVGLDLNRDAHLIVMQPDESCIIHALRPSIEADTLLIFGIAPASLGLRFKAPLYQPIRQGGITYFFADDLTLLFQERQRGEKERSAALWQGLQELFPDRP